MRKPNRRDFIKIMGTTAASAMILSKCSRRQAEIPSYLKKHEKAYNKNPHEAAREWFREARFGLFMHYGLYSLLGRGEWVMLHEKIPVAEYAKLKDRFTAENFDPNFITDLAIDAGMNYVNITSKHHDGFCLFKTETTDFNSAASPARRDLIGELSDACHKKDLGLFLYYSYAADWRHPYFYPREVGWRSARPAYETPESAYLWQKDEDFRIYVDYVHQHLRELLTRYGPIAGIWFDPIMGYYSRPDLFPIDETYALVRSLQPQTLISFKQGANGDEDFAAPERSGRSLTDRLDKPELKEIARKAWERNKNKHNEICDTLQPRVWGYKKADSGNHRTADEVMNMLSTARAADCNLLLNTGPLPGGSIDKEDEQTLRKVGRRLQA